MEDAWVRSVPSSSKHTAAYMILQNHGTRKDHLLSAQSDVAQVVEMHEVVKNGEMMSMQLVNSIPIPPHGSTKLKPGGYHLMLINLNRIIAAGEQVRLTLKFQHGGEITLMVRVQSEIMKDDQSKKDHDTSH